MKNSVGKCEDADQKIVYFLNKFERKICSEIKSRGK